MERYICEDQLHLSEEGRRACARQVEAVIRQQACLL
jgi:lysophospholipase L1-like esterase